MSDFKLIPLPTFHGARRTGYAEAKNWLRTIDEKNGVNLVLGERHYNDWIEPSSRWAAEIRKWVFRPEAMIEHHVYALGVLRHPEPNTPVPFVVAELFSTKEWESFDAQYKTLLLVRKTYYHKPKN